LREREQQIGKQDRRVDIDPANRLKCDGGREVGRSTDFEE
jgi:hypothetical protein